MSGHLERLRVFAAVAEAGSFTGAARRLGLSRSIATRKVAELESEIGAQLLVRTTRHVAPTLAGRLYHERALAILRDVDRAKDLVRQHQHGLGGPLRLSAPLSFGIRFLPDIVAQFRILHPRVDLTVSLADRFVDIVSEDFDMALRISEPPEDKSTIWRKICAVERLIVAAPVYLAKASVLAHPVDLPHHACLGYSHFAGGTSWRLTHGDGRVRAQTVSFAFECDNGDLIAALAARGEGVALLPAFVVSGMLASGALVRVLEDWAPPPVWLTAYYPPYDRLPAKVATFTEFVESVVLADPSMIS